MMEVVAKKSLYIRGLQAAYSGVLEIIDDAFHVAVYRYFPDRMKWERMDIEGSAYVTRNSSVPLYSLIVLNKKGASDLILHMEENIERAQIQDQYIMLRCKNQDGKVVLGVWVHDKADRDRLFGSIQRTKDIRKNSPDMTSLLSKYVQRSKSPLTQVAAPDADENSNFFSSSALPSSATDKPIDGRLVSALTASIAASSSSSQSNMISPVKSESKSTALLSFLKTSTRRYASDTTAEKSLEHGSPFKLNGQITTADSPASVQLTSGIASTDEIVKNSDSVGSHIQASAKLLRLLGGVKQPAESSTSLPTDSEISSRLKQQQSKPLASPSAPESSDAVRNAMTSSPLPASLALKAALCISGSQSPLTVHPPQPSSTASTSEESFASSSSVVSEAGSPVSTANSSNASILSARLLAAVSPAPATSSPMAPVAFSGLPVEGSAASTARKEKLLSALSINASASSVPQRGVSAPPTLSSASFTGALPSPTMPPAAPLGQPFPLAPSSSIKKVPKLISPADFGDCL